MIEIAGNLWALPANARCITTNGSRRRDGCAVMGRGVAAQAKAKWPSLQRDLGDSIRIGGNHVTDLGWMESHLALGAHLVSFPVKHHWDERADQDLIVRSCGELMELLDGRPWDRVLLPRPGCGNGRLRWDAVKLLVTPLLDDRVAIVHLPSETP